MSARGRWRFVLIAAGVWLLMTIVLVLVPDTLEQWLPLEVARVIGWVAATGLWMIVLDREWQRRLRPTPRYLIQVILWMSAAFVALWISEQSRVSG